MTGLRCICTPFDGPRFDCPIHGPCEGCYYVTAQLMVHDGTCDGLTARNADQMRADWNAAHPKVAAQGDPS